MMRQTKIGALLGLSVLVWLMVTFVGGVPGAAQDDSGFATNTPDGASGGPLFATNTPVLDPVLPAATTTPAPAGTALFATNTPENASPMLDFATNTPVGGATAVPTATRVGPQAAAFNYSLNIWLERDLVDLVVQQIQGVTADDEDAQLALQLSLYELERRFPGAPRDRELRRQIVNAMIAAPTGIIDMRSMVRPFIEDALNETPDAMEFAVEGFQVVLTSANLDNRGEMDALVNIVYQQDGELLYDDYVLALREGSTYRFLPDSHGLFAAPFGDIRSIAVDRISDVNRDALDEVVLRVDDGRLNQRLYILGVRNDEVLDLVPSGQEIRLSEIISWPTGDPDEDDPVLRVIVQRAESQPPDWPCVSQQAFDWTYELNFYRVSSALNARFERVDSLGCTLLEAEPIFERPPEEAISLVENALLDYTFEAEGTQRALLTLAMLYVLQGRVSDAQATAQAVLPAGEVDSWAHQQASAMLEALGVSGNTALDICAALAAASQAPACDIDAVLGRYLESVPLSTDADLVMQLEEAGLPVTLSVQVSELGRAERTVVNFELAGISWWAFRAERDGTYAGEPTAPPPGYETVPLAEQPVEVPQAAFDALFVNDDPAEALTVIETLLSTVEDRSLSPAGLYLQALSYDLLADREDARLTYYAVWSRYPTTIWGEIASRHLELR